jgi:hypothetical protein
MKNFLKIALLCGVVFAANGMTACNNSDTTDIVTVTTSPAALSFAPEGGTQFLTVECLSDDWYVLPVESWISAAKKEGRVEVTVESTVETRNGSIVVAGADNAKIVAVTQAAPDIHPFVASLLGEWTSSGYAYHVELGSVKLADFTVTISLVDSDTVLAQHAIGLDKLFGNQYSPETDRLTIDVDAANRTITIPSQTLTPSIAVGGVETWLCRFKNPLDVWSSSGRHSTNWKVGFDDIPVSDDMVIDLGAGGQPEFEIDGSTYGASFIPLVLDPNDSMIKYLSFFMAGTVWTKNSTE